MSKKHPNYQAPSAHIVRVGVRFALQASFTTPVDPLTPVEYEEEGFWN
ncbi:MAG: hypothetical protein J6T35_05665 [Bacteroidales bacterium]|nr:hypothetical protein [Bacteroidales bacterium]